ncbi:pyridoxal phosphate-dependent aminotransferase [Nisaea acidiphila]|uniref:Aminotransferase n=1 Tax=Nisaea acidiphila TaxID=1862145 RepID=A0A9J7ANG4_9PROT|nr:pyridoxal phosphate-dependent aminotransferase [Nisaea acidiphila]UUX49179.1 pyridoxal phosphate-dependent aminotransferase [Nisaea acidiphila]
MSFKVSRRGDVPPFIVMDVMQAAEAREKAGGDVLHLEVGQPSTPAPRRVLEAAKRALDEDRIGYTLASGIDPLRERIARHYKDWYGVSLDPAQVMVTTGSSGAFQIAFLAAFEAGDRVAMASPGYPAYRNILSALGVEPVLLETGPEHRYQPTPALLDAADGELDGLIVASPSNPSGTMLGEAEMAALTRYCREKGIRLVSDEIYHGIDFGIRSVSALESDDNAIVINSFSKYFSMTGWRLGWMVVPRDLAGSMERLAQNFFISPPTLSQFAGLAAFDCGDELQANVARYARNREVLLNDLPAAGLDDLAPADGAFYIYADVSRYTNDSAAFSTRMLNEIGVAATPGIDFDPARGHGTLRFSFAGATGDMVEAAARLKGWLKG